MTTSVKSFPTTLSELYSHPDFQPFGSTSDDWINDPERMERCNDAAENGSDGSTHAEVIQDWREFLSNLERDTRHTLEDDEQEQLEALVESITAEIDACEAYHESAGTLHSEIG